MAGGAHFDTPFGKRALRSLVCGSVARSYGICVSGMAAGLATPYLDRYLPEPGRAHRDGQITPSQRLNGTQPNASLYYVTVTQEHLGADQSATWQNPASNVAVIPHEERVLSGAALDALRAEGEPIAAVYAGFAVNTVVLDDDQELAYYWCHDGISHGCLRTRARRRDGTADCPIDGPADPLGLLH